MKTTSLYFFCLIVSLLVYSCGQSAEKQPQLAQDSYEYNGQTYTLKKTVPKPIDAPTKKETPKIIFHKVPDTQRNMAMGFLPLPSNWVVKDQADAEGAQIFGPNNIRVFLTRNKNFVYSQISGFNQMMAEQGYQIKPLKRIEQLVEEELVPSFASEGINLIKQYRVPQLKAYDENYDQFVFKPVPIQKTFDVLATEWGDKKGNRLLLIIRQNTAYTQEGCYWGYFVNMMDAPEAHFEEAKNNYYYALENTKFNPEWLQKRYMDDAQLSARMGKLHQERMRGLIAEGQAIIERGKAHSAAVDANHERWMDTHLERTNISNPNGQSFKVDAGSKEYWMNGSHEYIRSDDVFYDPNMDDSVNNETWTKMTINN
tara:strand:+ start:555 stop:1664 length:1110 start_codon:yes stop_codon:yes gene_type:complete